MCVSRLTRWNAGVNLFEYYLVPQYAMAGHAMQPLERARVRQFAEMINSGIQPLQNLAVLMQCVRTTQLSITKAFLVGPVRYVVISLPGRVCLRCG